MLFILRYYKMNLITALETALKKAKTQDNTLRERTLMIDDLNGEIERLEHENKALKDEHAKLLLEVQRLQRMLEVNNIIYPK